MPAQEMGAAVDAVAEMARVQLGEVVDQAVTHPRVIQKFAGWTSLRMLERYGHVRDVAEQQAATAIASHLDGIAKRITRDQAQSGE